MKNNKELILKLLLLFLLNILVFITSFRSGEKLYFLEDSISKNSAAGSVARWNFNARIIKDDEEEFK